MPVTSLGLTQGGSLLSVRYRIPLKWRWTVKKIPSKVLYDPMKAPTLLLLLVTTAVVVSKGRAQGDVVVFEPPTAEAVQKGKREY